jgi:hypothetical protein
LDRCFGGPDHTTGANDGAVCNVITDANTIAGGADAHIAANGHAVAG